MAGGKTFKRDQKRRKEMARKLKQEEKMRKKAELERTEARVYFELKGGGFQDRGYGDKPTADALKGQFKGVVVLGGTSGIGFATAAAAAKAISPPTAGC